MTPAELLAELPITATADVSIDDARHTLEHCRIRHLPVVDGKDVIGLISDRDMLIQFGLHHDPETLAPRPEILETRLGEIMSTPVHCLPDNATIPDIANLMIRERISAVPIVDGEGFKGVITKTDLLRWYYQECESNGDPSVVPTVAEWMTPHPVTCSADQEAYAVFTLMRQNGVTHLPVFDHSELVGILSDRDLRRWLGVTVLDELEADAETRLATRQLTARNLMSLRPRTIDSDSRVCQACKMMVELKIGCLPVLDHGGRLTGIISVSDIVRSLPQAWELQTAARAHKL